MGDQRHPEHPMPNEVLANLLDGHRRFLSGRRRDRDLPVEVAAGRDGQRPPIAMVSCIDSRVAPELVFDLGIGEAFDVRLAGAIVDDAALGSLEFACGAVGSVLLVVMGHTGCGAVKAACDAAAGADVASGGMSHLPAIVEPILEAVEAETETVTDRDSSNAGFVDRVAEINVHRTIMEIRERSNLLQGLDDSGRLLIVGMMYDVRDGAVRVLD